MTVHLSLGPVFTAVCFAVGGVVVWRTLRNAARRARGSSERPPEGPLRRDMAFGCRDALPASVVPVTRIDVNAKTAFGTLAWILVACAAVACVPLGSSYADAQRLARDGRPATAVVRSSLQVVKRRTSNSRRGVTMRRYTVTQTQLVAGPYAWVVEFLPATTVGTPVPVVFSASDPTIMLVTPPRAGTIEYLVVDPHVRGVAWIAGLALLGAVTLGWARARAHPAASLGDVLFARAPGSCVDL